MFGRTTNIGSVISSRATTQGVMESTALALVPTTSQALQKPSGATDITRLQQARDEHRYKQIWTKDAHGGPYKKVNANKGYDPMKQNPDGTDIKLALGYQRAETGPTTNFVGNHMTQAAIDLVQAELQEPVLPAPLLLDSSTSTSNKAPLLIATLPESDVERRATPLHTYSWWDNGSSVCIKIDLGSIMQDAGQPCVTASCTFTDTSVHVVIGTPGSSCSGQWNFGVPRLYQPILPAASKAFASGVACLPASTGPEPQPSCPPDHDGASTTTLVVSLPHPTQHLQLELRKADSDVRWNEVHGSQALQVASPPALSTGPDLTSLRRSIRQLRRGGAPVAPFQISPAAVSQVVQEPQQRVCSADEALERGRSHLQYGSFDLAIDDFSLAVGQSSGAALREALLARAAALEQVERYGQAVADVQLVIEEAGEGAGNKTYLLAWVQRLRASERTMGEMQRKRAGTHDFHTLPPSVARPSKLGL